MFLPAWFGVVLILCWLVLGGLAGALVGRAAARVLRLGAPRPGADAAAGAAGVCPFGNILERCAGIGAMRRAALLQEPVDPLAARQSVGPRGAVPMRAG